MTTIHIQATVEHDGEVHLSNLPLKRGQVIELQIQVAPEEDTSEAKMTAQQLVNSDIVGVWEGREDIKDTVSFAQNLRAQAQHRER